jgi:hypothetical protein
MQGCKAPVLTVTHDAVGTDIHNDIRFVHCRLCSTPITAASCIVMSSQVGGSSLPSSVHAACFHTMHA